MPLAVDHAFNLVPRERGLHDSGMYSPVRFAARILTTSCLTLSLSRVATGQFIEPSGNASAQFRSFEVGPYPNVDLPSRIKADDGKLTVFVDFEHPAAEGFPVYFINRTRVTVKFSHFGETDPLKLEVKDEKTGTWRRAQAGFWLRTCATVGPAPVVQPGMHFRSHGYRPKDGIKGTVRYRNVDWDISSNEGPGLWREKDLAAAAVDGGNFSEAPFSSLLRLSADPSVPLGDITADEMEHNLAALELFQLWDDNYLFRHLASAAKRDFEARRTLDAAFAKAALERLDEILASRTELEASSSARLYEGCLAAVRSSDRTRFGSAAKLPSVAWRGIAWIADNNQLTPDQWKECYTAIRQRLPEAEAGEQKVMGSLIERAAANEYLDNKFLIEGAGKAYPGIQDSCMRQLANRELWPELMTLAEQEDNTGKLRILRYICVDHRSEYPNRYWLQTYDESIIRFWKQCIHADFGGTVRTMFQEVGIDNADRLHFPPWQFLEFRESAKKLLAKAEKEPWPVAAQDSFYLGYFLATYSKGGSSRDPLLLSFAAVGAARPNGETDEQNQGRLRAALAAKRLLKAAEAEEMR